jgi:hypothetical protein
MKYPPNFQDVLNVFGKLKEPQLPQIPPAEQRRLRRVAHLQLTKVFSSLAAPTPQAKEALKILKLGVRP